ncbi:hypothetical protein PSN45_000964 [Yamadazyma tenuis]|uniref:Uncharacterized protein n=1 Tax=Candida tenuis (strain ATCC 10573 / BCRC 21748 / CBS 615 / JCM 9827 / NBRC 10315 / NRRL Y-1498 / VKM Y-70) TaxID=590646 RepID=G3B7C7_CANTC|nr:uncharacterized protein CANTEDRAFT_107774 [Yamadazyma tenuis ATCC 10573]EGV62243.1 hypothetical protein CANTEDRAFT_107774 [Yamadazyma tenuis ATCC 10573]WEJ93499.1 hypothetical protein PSN45_000964 [Yamadazyma tenuis]
MSEPIPLEDLKGFNKQPLEDLRHGLDAKLYPTPKYVLRRLVINLLVETVLSVAVYNIYDDLSTYYQLLGPALLGGSTAMLAQSITQFVRRKLSYNKICKFLVWGIINGSFTVLWYNMLLERVDDLIYQIVVDQMVGQPFFQLIFNVLSALWDHGEITANTRTIYLKSLKVSYCFWPFFSILVFAFIPPSLMFPSTCLANLLWNLVLSKLG